MRIALAAGLWLMFLSASSAQYPGNGAATNPYGPPDPPQKRNPFPFSGDPGTPKSLDNQVRRPLQGNLNANPYDPNNVNPYGPEPQYRPGNP